MTIKDTAQRLTNFLEQQHRVSKWFRTTQINIFTSQRPLAGYHLIRNSIEVQIQNFTANGFLSQEGF